MIEVLDQTEEASYPAGDAALWARLFAYIRTRWPARRVTWTVSGCGFFAFRLRPATLVSVTDADGGAVDAVSIPGGLVLPGGLAIVVCTVGAPIVPPDAQRAYQRLADYLAELEVRPGITSETVGGVAVVRNLGAVARALQLSGAADLLRPYR